GARGHAHDGLLDALGARALPADVGRGAGRTAVGRAAFVAAKVAAQHLVLAVIGHAHAAMRALLDVAALAALHRGRVAAAVDEEDGLLAPFEARVHGVNELTREHGKPALAHDLDAHVHHVDVGQLPL